MVKPPVVRAPVAEALAKFEPVFAPLWFVPAGVFGATVPVTLGP